MHRRCQTESKRAIAGLSVCSTALRGCQKAPLGDLKAVNANPSHPSPQLVKPHRGAFQDFSWETT
jgi:hypothetical protein